MTFPIKTRERVSIFIILISSFILNTVTSQNLEPSNIPSKEISTDDNAKIDIAINEQQGKLKIIRYT